MTTFTLNGEVRSVDTDPETPALWVIREQLDLTGTKFGCGMAQCGACTIHVDGRAQQFIHNPGFSNTRDTLKNDIVFELQQFGNYLDNWDF